MDMDVSQTPKSGQDDSQARPDNTIRQYQDTAYNSQNFPPQKPRQEKGFLRRMITSGKPFSLSQTTDSITIYGLDDLTPSEMAEGEKGPKPMYWTETKLTGESLSGWSQVYVLIGGIANVCLMFALPLLYAIFLLGLFIGKSGVVAGWNDGYADIFFGNYSVRDFTLFNHSPSLSRIKCRLHIRSAVSASQASI